MEWPAPFWEILSKPDEWPAPAIDILIATQQICQDGFAKKNLIDKVGKSQKPARKIGTRSWFVRVRQKFGSTLNLLLISDIDAICIHMCYGHPTFPCGSNHSVPLEKKIWFPTRHSKSQTWVNPIVDGEVLVLFVELRVWLLKRLFLACC
jgi:hypothetical protein